MKGYRLYPRLAGILVLAGLGTQAPANMGHSSSTYGVLPSDIATAQALSIFNPQVSAVYYNPGNLAATDGGELTGSILHGEHELRAESQGGAAPASRTGDIINDTPSQQLMIGMSTDMSQLFTFEHPIYFGFMAGVEKFGQEMLAFNSKSGDGAQYFRYERQPLFLTVGAGTQVWRGLDAGLSTRITLHNRATLNTQTDLAGNTQYEQMSVEAEPTFQPIAGLNLNWGETFCDVQECWMNNLDTSLSFRNDTRSKTSVDANTVIPGTIGQPGLQLNISTIDSFEPETTALGVKYDFGGFRLGVTGEYQAWSQLEDELQGDDVKTQQDGTHNLNFKDTFIPRVGGQVDVGQHLTLSGGLAYSESPLEKGTNPDVNYLDNDRMILGLGGTLNLEHAPMMDWPVRLDFGYQFHRFDERDFDLVSTKPGSPNGPYETVTADGEAHVFSGSFSLQF